MNTVKKMPKTMTGHGFTQFELTNNLINNLQQFEISPTSKLVLIYLTSCFNPKKADVFPKQKTIASKLGISERSVVRAISELNKAGLILIECKYTNRYKLTSKIACKCPQYEKFFEEEKLSVDLRQIDTKEDDKLSDTCIEQKIETKKEQQNSVSLIKPANKMLKAEEYKILEQYALSKKATNVTKYINYLIFSGASKDIIKRHKEEIAVNVYHQREVQRTSEYIASITEGQEFSCHPRQSKLWADLREKMQKLQ